jgi:hypothetical protein
MRTVDHVLEVQVVGHAPERSPLPDCPGAAEGTGRGSECGQYGVSYKRPGPKRRRESKRLGSDSRP